MTRTASIFAKLKQDHDRHRALLKKIDGSDGEKRASLFEEFRVEVTAHAAAEEETLYATMLGRPDLRHDAQHSVAEHKEIDDFLEELEELDAKSDDWKEKYSEMKDRYLHHIEEEEEDMFPAAEDGLSDGQIKELAALFDKRKPAELERAEEGVDQGDDRD
jgi:hemerythrin-like domain-containing protein